MLCVIVSQHHPVGVYFCNNDRVLYKIQCIVMFSTISHTLLLKLLLSVITIGDVGLNIFNIMPVHLNSFALLLPGNWMIENHLMLV